MDILQLIETIENITKVKGNYKGDSHDPFNDNSKGKKDVPLMRNLDDSDENRKILKDCLIKILECEEDLKLEQLYKAAQRTRQKIFHERIFLYGFVYFSTFCRNDCRFCYYRKSNPIKRYRKSKEEILETVSALAISGVHLIDLTMGEDMQYHEEQFHEIAEIIAEIKAKTGLPVMISAGVVPPEITERLALAGADWFALYQETHNRQLFQKLRIDQDYDERMNCKLYAKQRGMLIEEGILAGTGESLSDIADSLLEMGRIGASQVRVMSFVPQDGIPMEHVPTPNRKLELKIISLLRLLYPYALIPASLDVDGIAGLKSRILAGANVVTSIIPPLSGFAGVAQNSMDVDEGGRTVKEAVTILNEIGLEAASATEYIDYIEKLG